MRKKIVVALAAGMMVSAMGSPAMAAHEHTLTTPGGNQVVLPCEPAAAAELHPIHNGLHVGLRDNPGNEQVTMTTEADGCL